MPAPRIFIDGELAAGTRVTLPTAAAHHALRVLRLRDRAAITVFNGRGGEFGAVFATAPPSACIERFDPVERESPLRLALIQALVASEKLDWAVEKAVELGVARIVIAPAARSVVQLHGERQARRLARWREIAIAACCQSGRNRLPAIDLTTTLDAAFAAMGDFPQRFVLTPAVGQPLSAARPSATCIAVGPEGGFDDDELQRAARLGFVAAHWGLRVLRTETAGLAALAALQTLHGDGAPRGV